MISHVRGEVVQEFWGRSDAIPGTWLSPWYRRLDSEKAAMLRRARGHHWSSSVSFCSVFIAKPQRVMLEKNWPSEFL